MPTTPRRPKDVDLRSQLRKQLRKVKKRVNSQASASKNNHQTTASEKWKIYKSTFEESRQKEYWVIIWSYITNLRERF
jgi:hypothetical protein